MNVAGGIRGVSVQTLSVYAHNIARVSPWRESTPGPQLADVFFYGPNSTVVSVW